MSLPVAVTISGTDSPIVLAQNLAIARGFKPLGAAQMTALRERCRTDAGDGRPDLHPNCFCESHNIAATLETCEAANKTPRSKNPAPRPGPLFEYEARTCPTERPWCLNSGSTRSGFITPLSSWMPRSADIS
ncbi:MAG: hypothetical protein ABJC09_02320 [Terriglobia bacterium]